MRVEDYGIKSYIQNNKKLLIWKNGSNIDNVHFTGLGFGEIEENQNNLFYINHEDELEKYQNESFDYFFIHGFQVRNFDHNSFKTWNIKIGKITLDYLGEGFDIYEEIDKGELIEKYEGLCDELIISTGFKIVDRVKSKYPNVRFFEHDLSGPRVFCSPYCKNMVHTEYFRIDETNYVSRRWLNDDFLKKFIHTNVHELIMGLEWSDNHKHKLFQWTPGTARPFRIVLQNQIEKHNLLDFGYISFRRETQDNIFIWDEIENNKRDWPLQTKHCELDEMMFDTLFALHRPIAKNSYISLVSESAHYKDVNFITEKCVKPFYNLQFPIIQGHQGIISDLRKMDFDMFDDIIDHSYDDLPVEDRISYVTKWSIKKSIKIAEEISKLKDVDIHRLYLKNKERFIYNQENLYKKTISENDIFQKMGEFIFGDDLKVVEPNKSVFTKIWI